MTILRWVLTAFVGLAFLFFGSMKVFGVPEKMFQEQKTDYFDKYGIDRTKIRAIGLMELFGGITVWLWNTQLSQLALLGSLVLMVVTLGAMFFHNKYDSVTKDGLPAIIQFVLSSVISLLHFI